MPWQVSIPGPALIETSAHPNGSRFGLSRTKMRIIYLTYPLKSERRDRLISEALLRGWFIVLDKDTALGVGHVEIDVNSRFRRFDLLSEQATFPELQKRLNAGRL